MRVSLFDIETDGLLNQCTKITHMCVKSYDGELENESKYLHFSDTLKEDGTIAEGIQYLLDSHTLIGHNILEFDIRVIEKLHNVKFNHRTFDTLVASRAYIVSWDETQHRDKSIKSYSLKSWGDMFNLSKLTFPEDRLDEKLKMYCQRDVEITYKLWKLLRRYIKENKAIYALEEATHKQFIKMTDYGIPLDREEYVNMLIALKEYDRELQTKLAQMFPDKVVEYYTEKKKEKKFKVVKFNPGSGKQVHERLVEKYGWVPEKFTDKNQPQVTKEVLDELPYPEAKLLSEYLDNRSKMITVEKWTEYSSSDRLHGSYRHIGAVTHRTSSYDPNLQNITALIRKPIKVKPGLKLVGVDLSALEARIMAHYLHPYDHGLYGKRIDTIHEDNMKKLDINDRGTIKAIFYGFNYGASPAKLGRMASLYYNKDGTPIKQEQYYELGLKIKNKLLAGTKGLNSLLQDLETQWQKTSKIVLLDGRSIYVSSQHKLLNSLCQGNGSVITKDLLLRIVSKLNTLNGFARVVLFVHDEYQIECDEGLAVEVINLCKEACKETTQHYNLSVDLELGHKIGQSWFETH